VESLKKYLLPIGFSLCFLVLVSWLSLKKAEFLNALRYYERTYSSQGLQAKADSALVQVYKIMQKAEGYWYDLKFGLKPRKHARKVAVATIDDLSLDVYGRWPWDRQKFEVILDKLYALGAKTVAFDVVFSEPEISRDYIQLSFSQPLPGSDQSYQQKLGLSDAQVAQLVDIVPGVGGQYFSQALRKYPKTVLGYLWQDSNACRVYNPQDPEWLKLTNGQELSVKEAAAAGFRHVEDLIDNLGAIGGQGIVVDGSAAYHVNSKALFPVMSCPVSNESSISTYAQYQGFFNFIPDLDGLFRKYAAVFAFATEKIPEEERDFLPGSAVQWFENATFFSSLGIKALESYWGATLEPVLKKDEDGREYVETLNFKKEDGKVFSLPLRRDGTFYLDFYGNQASDQWFSESSNTSAAPPILQFSLADLDVPDLRAPEFAKNYNLDISQPLKDFVVFIGPTSLGVYDIRPTPVQTDMPGVFLHATAVGKIIEAAESSFPSFGIREIDVKWELVWLWLLSLMALFVIGFFRASIGIPLIFFVIFGLLVVDYYLFTIFSLKINAVLFVVSGLIVSMSMFLYKYFTEERDRAFVKAAFEKYVSPKVVDSIVKDPKKLDLGGRKEDLTVLFSDIRGFTTISEKLGASELASFLNDYLTPMSDIIMDNSGTIDKYMGDAIMAIFGAPVPMENHAKSAVDASLAMLEKLKLMQVEWAEKGLPHIDIGIGLNTGEMSVGNMGSKKIFSYTVMGDSVNLGSRLEGINKEYGTRLIVSQSTRLRLPANYVCRQLDRVKVKGKTEPVTIFEVQGVDLVQERIDSVASFEKALDLYFKQDFKQALQEFDRLAEAGDATAVIFEQRCELFIEEPPPEGWDGTWVMTSK